VDSSDHQSVINPFSDLGKETQNPFLDTRIRIWIFPKKRTLKMQSNLIIYVILSGVLIGRETITSLQITAYE